MFDKTPLQTAGVITLPVQHLITGKKHKFYIATRHKQAILGFQACHELHLLIPVHENIYVMTSSEQTSSSQACITEQEIIAQYSDLFEGVGRLEGTVHFDVDKTVRPVQNCCAVNR